MKSDARLTLQLYWARLGPQGRRAFCDRAGYTFGHVEHIVGGRRRASQQCAIRLVFASGGEIRPHSIRPDLWTRGEAVSQWAHHEALRQQDLELEARITQALQAWESCTAQTPEHTRAQLLEDAAELIRQRSEHVSVLLECLRQRQGAATALLWGPT